MLLAVVQQFCSRLHAAKATLRYRCNPGRQVHGFLSRTHVPHACPTMEEGRDEVFKMHLRIKNHAGTLRIAHTLLFYEITHLSLRP